MTSLLNGAAIEARLRELAAFTDEPGRMTRLTLGPAHAQAADRVAGWMRGAGLEEVRRDGLGNVRGRRGPHDRKALVLGSHIDTVIDGGIYDGNLGVVLAIAVADATRETRTALEVVAFADEEGVRFPSTLTGSRALAGRYDPTWLDERDRDGVTRRAALQAFGVTPGWRAGDTLDPAMTRGYVEVHIEQGPVLEAEGRALGIVTAIAGASRRRVTVTGEAGHAGTLPMAMRRDALAAAAEMVLAVEARARATPGLVGTVGRIEVAGGGAVNIVPGAATFSLDLRAPEDAMRKAALSDLAEAFAAIARRRGVAAALDMPYDAPAAPCDPHLQQALAEALAQRGHDVFCLPSGAGHDAMAFRERLPLAMLFVRCAGGISHNPAEACAPADMEAAALTMRDAVLALGDTG
jgi:allantoate deiminase